MAVQRITPLEKRRLELLRATKDMELSKNALKRQHCSAELETLHSKHQLYVDRCKTVDCSLSALAITCRELPSNAAASIVSEASHRGTILIAERFLLQYQVKGILGEKSKLEKMIESLQVEANRLECTMKHLAKKLKLQKRINLAHQEMCSQADALSLHPIVEK